MQYNHLPFASDLSQTTPAQPPIPATLPRLRTPERDQVLMQMASLDDLILPEHPVRPIWQIVNLWPMDQFLKDVKARQGCVGRDITDPRVLLTLWLYATTRNIASGREIERLCQTDLVFQWICGGLSLNYHTINDFRVAHEAALDDLLTQMLATLTKNGVVKVQRITQDGTKVRA